MVAASGSREWSGMQAFGAIAAAPARCPRRRRSAALIDRARTTGCSARRSRDRRTRSCCGRRCGSLGEDSIVLNPRGFRRRRLGGSGSARAARSRGRRSAASARRCARARGRCSSPNLHATSHPADWRLADAELLRAAVFADSVAEPGDVLVLAGDFNVIRERRATLPTSLADGASRSPVPGSTRCSSAAARPGTRSAGRTSGARVDGSAAVRPRAGRGGDRMTFEEARAAVPGPRALRVPERGHERAARRARPSRRWSSRSRRGSRARAQRRGRTSTRPPSCATRCARSSRRLSACAPEHVVAHDLDDGRLQHRARGPRARARGRDRHDRRRALRPARRRSTPRGAQVRVARCGSSAEEALDAIAAEVDAADAAARAVARLAG